MVAMRSILGVSRAPFLLLPVTLVAVGAAASAHDGGFDVLASTLCLVGLVAAHVGVNALNEASDMQTGIDLATVRTPFSGGSGTLPAGEMSVRGAYVLGFVATGIGLGIGVGLTIRVGPVMITPLAIGAFSVIAYTHLLARVGLGEFFAGLGLGALPVLGTSLAQDGALGPASVAASIPAFFTTLNLLLLNEFPDEAADREGGRRNLVLMLGRPTAAKVFVLATLAVPAALAVSVALDALPWYALAAILPTALAVPACRWALASPDAKVPHAALGGNVFWNLGTNVVLAVALLF